MATPEQLAELKAYLVAYGGGYLRNTRWDSAMTCGHCAGIPGNSSFASCYQCHWQYQPNQEATDLRGFVSYGWDNSQSARVMYGYKVQNPAPQAYRVVHVMLFYALHEHLGCTATTDAGVPTRWATVPSLKDRGYPQALHTIAAQTLPGMPEATMAKAANVVSPRGFRPENFTVTSDVVGQHILLLEDTWTTGAHAESAAAALKRAGARRVTLLTIARWLDPSRGSTTDFMKTELTADFNPDVCPFPTHAAAT